jgi:SAM-dependent methyltransferase
MSRSTRDASGHRALRDRVDEQVQAIMSSLSPRKDSPLDIMGREFGTDKSSAGHDYLHFYERFFKELRDQPIRFLEIGVGDGGSMRLWEKYFGFGCIVGMDSDASKKDYGSKRVTVIHGNQGSVNDLTFTGEQCGPFDVINDDASHNWEDQLLSLQTLFQFLKPGGYYVLEDLGGKSPGLECSGELSQLVRKLVAGNRKDVEFMAFYHETVVIRKAR